MSRFLVATLLVLTSVTAFAQKKEKKERKLYYSPASINRENYIKQNGKWVTKPELYTIKQNDPNCVPKLLIGYGIGLTGLEFAGYLDLYALYEIPKIGTLTFNQQIGINSKKFGGNFREIFPEKNRDSSLGCTKVRSRLTSLYFPEPERGYKVFQSRSLATPPPIIPEPAGAHHPTTSLHVFRVICR